MKTITSFLIVLFINSILFTQTRVETKIIKTDTDKYPVVNSAVLIFDKSNDRVVKDLKPENFNITLGGKKADSIKVKTYEQSGIGLYIVLALDVSGTMAGDPITNMKNAVKRFIDKLRPVDKLAIYTFSDDVKLISDFSNDKTYLKEVVDKIVARGLNTELFYGTYTALKKNVDLDNDQVGKILMVVSDGKDESVSKTYNENDIISLANDNGIPIFTIGYTKINPTYLQTLEKISDKTNGIFFKSPSDNQLDEQYSKLFNTIMNINILNYLIFDLAGDGNEYVQIISVNYNDIQSLASNKVILPLNRPALTKPKLIKENNSNLLYYLIIGGVLLIVLAGVIIVKKKKKQEIPKIESQQESKNDYVVPQISTPETQNIHSSSNNFYGDKTKVDASYDKTIVDYDEKTMIVDGDKKIVINFISGPLQNQKMNFSNAEITIGRSEGNLIKLTDNYVSKFHAKLYKQNDTFFIEDLNSSNGTFLNGQKVIKSPISNSDVIKIGSSEFQVFIF